jgi:hypothetical protein
MFYKSNIYNISEKKDDLGSFRLSLVSSYIEVDIFCYFFLAVLGLELSALHLLGRYSAAWPHLQPFSYLSNRPCVYAQARLDLSLIYISQTAGMIGHSTI